MRPDHHPSRASVARRDLHRTIGTQGICSYVASMHHFLCLLGGDFQLPFWRRVQSILAARPTKAENLGKNGSFGQYFIMFASIYRLDYPSGQPGRQKIN